MRRGPPTQTLAVRHADVMTTACPGASPSSGTVSCKGEPESRSGPVTAFLIGQPSSASTGEVESHIMGEDARRDDWRTATR